MFSEKRCTNKHLGQCGGFVTTTEIKMNEINGSRSAQEYHEIMALFEEAFYQDSSND